MLVYHGSTVRILKPDVNYGRHNLDFGRGFYATTLQKQAEKWAKRRAVTTGKEPVVSVYDFDVSDLSILTFHGYSEEWLDFVVKNRSRTIGQEAYIRYDATFGNIADDDVAATVDEYMRLLSKGRVNIDVKNATLYQLTFAQPNNQYCIATQKGIDMLAFKESYILEER